MNLMRFATKTISPTTLEDLRNGNSDFMHKLFFIEIICQRNCNMEMPTLTNMANLIFAEMADENSDRYDFFAFDARKTSFTNHFPMSPDVDEAQSGSHVEKFSANENVGTPYLLHFGFLFTTIFLN